MVEAFTQKYIQEERNECIKSGHQEKGGVGSRCNHRMALPRQREVATRKKRCLVQYGASEEAALCSMAWPMARFMNIVSLDGTDYVLIFALTAQPRNLDARINSLIQRLCSTAKILLREYFRKYGNEVANANTVETKPVHLDWSRKKVWAARLEWSRKKV